jgi:hypothetical protein
MNSTFGKLVKLKYKVKLIKYLFNSTNGFD